MRQVDHRILPDGTRSVKSRIFTACHGTQLLVIQHLRRHLGLPAAREFLVWNPLGGSARVGNFMEKVISTAGFEGTLDLRSFESVRDRTQGAVAWWFEAPRRLRADLATLRSWMAEAGIEEETAELWTDDPIHFNGRFLKASLSRALQVRYPHCFNLEDDNSDDYRRMLAHDALSAPWLKRQAFWKWLKLTAGCDFNPERVHAFDVAYSFDVPSTWAPLSVDAAPLVHLDRFAETYSGLPEEMRSEVEGMLLPVKAGKRPLVVLLLFGLDVVPQEPYRSALSRIFAERSELLRGCTLAIKIHPGAAGGEEEIFFDWARNNLPAQIYPIRSAMNLEFMLPQLNPDFVLAGPCGALPLLRNLGMSRPIVLSDVMESMCEAIPADRVTYDRLVAGMEVW